MPCRDIAPYNEGMACPASDEVLETVPSGYRISSQGRVEPIDDDDDDYGPDDDEYNVISLQLDIC